MKVWELMAELAKHPAGKEISLDYSDSDGDIRFCANVNSVSDDTDDEYFRIYLNDEVAGALKKKS